MKHRLQFTIKKLFRIALLLLGVSLTAFLLMDASPLDPLQTSAAWPTLVWREIGRASCRERV